MSRVLYTIILTGVLMVNLFGREKEVFTVYALSDTVNVSGFLSEDGFLKLIAGKTLAKTQLTGTFTR